MKLKMLLISLSTLVLASCHNLAQTPIEAMSSSTPLTEKQVASPPPPTPAESTEELIAFVGRNEQTTSIGLMTSNGQSIRYITDTAGNERLPKWSPNGQHIAYVSDRQIPLNEHNRRNYDLWLLDLSDEQSTRLTQGGQVSSYLPIFAWSPSGDKIAYNASSIGISVAELTDLSTYTIGKHFDAPFAWSMNDKLALSDTYTDNPVVHSLAILNSEYRSVLPPRDGFVAGGLYPLNTATSLAWHPNDEQLAIGSYFALRGDSDLIIVSIVEEEVVVQASLVERFSFIQQNEVTDVVWSPDGTMIAFRFININDAEQTEDDIERIYVTNSELTELTALTPENMLCNYPQWSPDSTRLVFACQGEGEGNSDIWIVNKDGSNLQRLTDTPTYEGEPVWQPKP